jgi:hypothetical protein
MLELPPTSVSVLLPHLLFPLLHRVFRRWTCAYVTALDRACVKGRKGRPKGGEKKRRKQNETPQVRATQTYTPQTKSQTHKGQTYTFTQRTHTSHTHTLHTHIHTSQLFSSLRSLPRSPLYSRPAFPLPLRRVVPTLVKAYVTTPPLSSHSSSGVQELSMCVCERV